LISDRQNLAIVGRRKPVGAGVRQHPVACIWPPMDQILAGIRQRDWDVAEFWRHLPNSNFEFRNFFRVNQTQKNIFEKIIFSENDFVKIILRRKSFYVETNGV